MGDAIEERVEEAEVFAKIERDSTDNGTRFEVVDVMSLLRVGL